MKSWMLCEGHSESFCPFTLQMMAMAIATTTLMMMGLKGDQPLFPMCIRIDSTHHQRILLYYICMSSSSPPSSVSKIECVKQWTNSLLHSILRIVPPFKVAYKMGLFDCAADIWRTFLFPCAFFIYFSTILP